MQNAVGQPRLRQNVGHPPRDGFMIGAVVCAAVMVAFIAIHGPNIIGDRFTPEAFTLSVR